MGKAIEWLITPIAGLMDGIVMIESGKIPVGLLILLAAAFICFKAGSSLLERASLKKNDTSDPDTLIFRMICLMLNCALLGLFCTKYQPPHADYAPMLSGLAGDMSAASFSQWHIISKLFFWCAVVNSASTLISQVIRNRRSDYLMPLVFAVLGGMALGHALMPLSVALIRLTLLFQIVLPLVEGLLIGLMYLASVIGLIFSFISLRSADQMAAHASANLSRGTKPASGSGTSRTAVRSGSSSAREAVFPMHLTSPDGELYRREWAAGERAGYWCARTGQKVEFHESDFWNGTPSGWH